MRRALAGLALPLALLAAAPPAAAQASCSWSRVDHMVSYDASGL